MSTLTEVSLNRGLLTAVASDGAQVVVPVQQAVAAAARINTASGRDSYRFEINSAGRLFAIRVTDSGSIPDHPFFAGHPQRVYLGGTGISLHAACGAAIEVQLPARGADYFQAQAVLRRSHPRGVPPAGVMFTAKFSNTDDHKEFLSAARSKKPRTDPWSSAWQERPGGVVAAITVSRLFHGEPRGRQAIADHFGTRLPTGDRARREAVDRLGVVWVSRVAVDAPFRDLGIGPVLLKALRESLAVDLPWHPRAIEVLQARGAAEAIDDLKTPDASFFSRAGYERFPEATYTSPIRRVRDDGTLDHGLTPQRTLYYWGVVARP